MKIQVIGDIHGRTTWKNQIDLSCDKIIFIGDYLDSFNVEGDVIVNNFRDIINFKQSNPDKVVLLYGNHEFNYNTNPNENNQNRCSGYRYQLHWQLWQMLDTYKDFFQIAYQIKNWLFTHAGVHKGWYEYKAMLKTT